MEGMPPNMNKLTGPQVASLDSYSKLGISMSLEQGRKSSLKKKSSGIKFGLGLVVRMLV